MEKGKYGIRLGFYGVVAFIFAFFGWTTALILLTGFVIAAEKNEYASRQCIQAVVLCFVSGIISSFFSIFSFMYRIPFVGTAWGTVVSICESLVDIAILVFVIIAIVKNAKGQEANVPGANSFANWAYGKVAPKVQQPMYQQPMYQQPMQQPMQQQPMQQAPVQQAPVQPAAAADVCANCGAPLNGGAFCTKCGTPKAQ